MLCYCNFEHAGFTTPPTSNQDELSAYLDIGTDWVANLNGAVSVVAAHKWETEPGIWQMSLLFSRDMIHAEIVLELLDIDQRKRSK